MTTHHDLLDLAAAASLPWTVRDAPDYWEVIDATGQVLTGAQAARYLVAAANQAPALVTEVERLRAALCDLYQASIDHDEMAEPDWFTAMDAARAALAAGGESAAP